MFRRWDMGLLCQSHSKKVVRVCTKGLSLGFRAWGILGGCDSHDSRKRRQGFRCLEQAAKSDTLSLRFIGWGAKTCGSHFPKSTAPCCHERPTNLAHVSSYNLCRTLAFLRLADGLLPWQPMAHKVKLHRKLPPRLVGYLSQKHGFIQPLKRIQTRHSAVEGASEAGLFCRGPNSKVFRLKAFLEVAFVVMGQVGPYQPLHVSIYAVIYVPSSAAHRTRARAALGVSN